MRVMGQRVRKQGLCELRLESGEGEINNSAKRCGVNEVLPEVQQGQLLPGRCGWQTMRQRGRQRTRS